MKPTTVDTGRAYRRHLGRKRLTLLVLLGILLLACLLSVCAGSAGLGPGQAAAALLGGGTPESRTIVWSVRMPRTATAVGVGFALAMSGCVMQSVLRNPLASASTLGVTQGASFGAAAAIVALGTSAGGSVPAAHPGLVTLSAFLGGMATTAAILLLSRVGGASPSALVLAGVAISSLFTGATALVQYFADDVTVASVVYWTFGSLGRAGWGEIGLIFALCLLAFCYFFWNRWNYNALESGSAAARSLGVRVDALTLASLTVCALAAAAAVAFAGCISFIGLLAPHMVRRFTGSDYRFLIPGSALAGASVLLGADVLSRVVIPPTVLPIGSITAFLGAPVFLSILLKGGRHGCWR